MNIANIIFFNFPRSIRQNLYDMIAKFLGSRPIMKLLRTRDFMMDMQIMLTNHFASPQMKPST
jgi:hypothetical protein